MAWDTYVAEVQELVADVISATVPRPFSMTASTRLLQLLTTCFAHASSAYTVQLSVLIKGARGSGKSSMIRSLADEIGFNIVIVECYDLIGDTAVLTEGSIKAQLDKAKSCAPSILLLHQVEALSRKSESTDAGRIPPIVKVLEDALAYLKEASGETGWPCVMIGTTADEDAVPPQVLGCFKQDITLPVSQQCIRVSQAQAETTLGS